MRLPIVNGAPETRTSRPARSWLSATPDDVTPAPSAPSVLRTCRSGLSWGRCGRWFRCWAGQRDVVHLAGGQRDDVTVDADLDGCCGALVQPKSEAVRRDLDSDRLAAVEEFERGAG